MEQKEFDDLWNNYDNRFGSCDLPDFEQLLAEPNNLDWKFTESESSTLDPTKLDKNQGQFSADMAESDVNSFANHDLDLGRFSADVAESDVNCFANHDLDFPPINNGKQATPYESSKQSRPGALYTYDEFGQLEGNAGFGKEVIEHYLCKHHFYGERSNLKNCGLTLWIQRTPPNTDSYGPTPALCLYKDCHVDQNRHIQPGDIRIAFDEKTARGLERDPRVNAGYVHLKCLEAHIPNHRQMFADLNFQVEGRAPQKNDPWLNNPTIFTTLSQIVYAEQYIEGCSKESWNGGSTSDAILLSAGIEKHFRAEYPVVREIVSKILEMEGWSGLKAMVDSMYAQALSRKVTGNKIGRPLQPRSKPKGANRTGREAYKKKKKDHRGRDEIRVAKKVNRRVGRRNRYESPQIKESRIKTSEYSKKGYSAPKEKEPGAATEPQPLKKGEGKIKTRLYIKDGREVWEDYEDPWSPLISDMEEGTEDDDDNDDEWSGDEDSGDDEASIGGERRGRKRMRSDDEDDSEDDERRGRRRKRWDEEDDSEDHEPRNPKRKRTY